VSVTQELGDNESLIHTVVGNITALQTCDGSLSGTETAEIAALGQHHRELEMSREKT
jgi:hypothetical protein